MGSFFTGAGGGATPKDVWEYSVRRLAPETKIINVTHKAPVETLQATPTALPTAKPATPQKSWTVASTDLPTCDVAPDKIQFQAFIVVAGKNTDTVAQTVYVDVHVNGTLRVSGSASIPADYYWTANIFVGDVKIGDVIDVYVWASATTVNWDYDAYQIQVMNIVPKSGLILTCAFNTTAFNLTSGNPLIQGTAYHYVVNLDLVAVVSNASSGSVSMLYAGNQFILTYLVGYAYRNFIGFLTDSTYRPRYYRQAVVLTVEVVY
jgi:hypothetical protein